MAIEKEIEVEKLDKDGNVSIVIEVVPVPVLADQVHSPGLAEFVCERTGEYSAWGFCIKNIDRIIDAEIKACDNCHNYIQEKLQRLY